MGSPEFTAAPARAEWSGEGEKPAALRLFVFLPCLIGSTEVRGLDREQPHDTQNLPSLTFPYVTPRCHSWALRMLWENHCAKEAEVRVPKPWKPWHSLRVREKLPTPHSCHLCLVSRGFKVGDLGSNPSPPLTFPLPSPEIHNYIASLGKSFQPA